MPRGQKQHWQLLRGVPKGRTAKPHKVAPCIWLDNGKFHVYRYRGKTSTFVKSCATLAEALATRDGVELPAVSRTSGSLTIAAYFASTFLLVDRAERKPSTIRAMQSRFNAHVLSPLGNRPLADVTYDDLAWFAASLIRKKTGAKTRRAPDTRPASIRDALRVALRMKAPEHRELLIAIITQAYEISLMTCNAIAR